MLTSTQWDAWKTPTSIKDMPKRKMIDLKEQLGGKICLPKSILHFGECILGFDFLNRAHYSIDEDWDNGSTENFFRLACKYNHLLYDLNEGALDNIPKEGPCVIVSNHPHGFSDGLMFGDVAMKVRSDIRIVVNEFLDCVFGMRPYSIKVDVYGGKEATRANMSSMRDILKWLREGHCILVFPSGSVASYSHKDRRVIEDPWQSNIATIIRKTQATVVPMHIAGRSSLFFQALTVLCKNKRSSFIPREILRDSKQRHQITLGRPISPSIFSKMETDEQLSDYLRLRSSLLSYELDVSTSKPATAERQFEKIAPSQPAEKLIAEIDALGEDAAYYKSESAGLTVYMALAHQIPNLMQEIAIQREHIFRAVGEGTGKAFDRDAFDEYYGQLILWDDKQQQLAGAYRMGFTDQIIKERGIKGLYASSFYKIDEKAWPILSQGLDMGRAFIMPEYQRIPTSLDTLWMGIGRYMVRHNYRYLYGMVSVSADYREISRSCIRSFLEENKFNAEIAKGIHALAPANELCLRSEDCRLLPTALSKTKHLSQLITELEAEKQSIPVLLKHYLRLDGNAIGFSIDKDFGNTLDCFFLVDMSQAPERLKKRYLGEDCTL